jgi:hypothetical protein
LLADLTNWFGREDAVEKRSDAARGAGTKRRGTVSNPSREAIHGGATGDLFWVDHKKLGTHPRPYFVTRQFAGDCGNSFRHGRNRSRQNMKHFF